MTLALPSSDELYELFIYSHETGLLHWRTDRYRTKVKAGTVAGCELMFRDDLRRMIHITGKNYVAARLIAQMHLDMSADKVVLMRDDNTLNTRVENLALISMVSLRRMRRLGSSTEEILRSCTADPVT